MKLNHDNLMKILSSHVEPKISIILPIHPETPNVNKNILTYKNLLKEVTKDLELNYPRRQWSDAVAQLNSLLLNRVIWHDSEKALLIFANNETMEVCEMEHTVMPKQHVGSTFLVQDLLLPEEYVERPDYLINLSRDRINVFDTDTLQEVELAGVHNRFDNYYDDFDADSNLNSGGYGGKEVSYHGHRSKSEEQQKDQGIYYQYLNHELSTLNREIGYTFVLAGLPEMLDVYLKNYGESKYISGIMRGSLLNLTTKELSKRLNDYYHFERIADIESVKQSIEDAAKYNRVINDPHIIDFALNNRDVKSLVSFNDGNSYSVDHNKLLVKSIVNKIKCRVLYNEGDKQYSSMNAILY